MGCVNSRADINDLHPNIFQVMNVDDFGNLITPGRLEITESDIILYQRGKQSVKWPLRCLRRYGYDAEIFSFESGRRCSTGPGIYAFKCRRAAQLFNLVQTNIQVCNNGGEDTISREIPIASHPGATVTRVTIPPHEPNYLDPTPIRSSSRVGGRFSHSQQNGIGRLGSVGSSSGPMSPQDTIGSPSPPPMLPLPPPVPQPHPSSLYVNEEVFSSVALEMEHNNNKSLRRTMQRSYTMSSTTSSNGFMSTELMTSHSNTEMCHGRPPPLPTASYMNVDISSDVSPLSPSHSISESTPLREDVTEVNGADHAYMNISPGIENVESNVVLKTRQPPLLPLQFHLEEPSKHCYVNLEASEIEGLKKRCSGVSVPDKSPLPPSTPPAGLIREVNYAVLDLNTKESGGNSTASNQEGAVNSLPCPPDSPDKLKKGYATIDFNKTAALSHSVNPNLVNDNEGSRKTRHNSTINDLITPCRHSSSVSE